MRWRSGSRTWDGCRGDDLSKTEQTPEGRDLNNATQDEKGD